MARINGQKVEFVIAEQALGAISHTHDGADSLERFRTAIDDIADKNQTAFVRNLLEKLLQGIKTPVDIAYGISFHI